MISEFIVPPLVSSHPKVNKMLGLDWLNSKVEDGMKVTHGKATLHPSRMSPKFGWSAHPLVTEWKQKVATGVATPILDSLEIDLEDLRDTNLPKDLPDRLRDDHGFGKAAYELHIGAGFRRLGYYPVWCPPISHPHPEFLVLYGNTTLLSVECKKRDRYDGYETQANQFWKHLQYELRKNMSNSSLNYWIKVSGKFFELDDVQPLVSEIVSTIGRKDTGESTALNGRYRFEFVKLADPGESIDMNIINMFPRGDMGINTGRGYRAMVGPLTDPKLLRMEFLDDPDQRIKGIIRNLKNATNQVLKGLPNLIYLDVNIPDYLQEQEEFGNMVDAVKKTICGKHTRVSGVVITNIFQSLSLDNHLGGVSRQN